MIRCALTVLIGCSFLASVASARVVQNVVVLLDDSGSMAEPMRSGPRVRRIDAAKQALLQVLEQLPDDAHVGVFALNSRTATGPWIIPLGPIDRTQIQQAIQSIQAQGGTPLGAAMKEATDALLTAREKQFYGQYRLLIVTDGEAQDEPLVDRYLPDILNRQITVDVIGVAMGQNHSLATRVDRYRRADDPASLREAIKQSLAETPLDPQDANQASDFELLAGLSDEVAVAAIQALSATDNRPIGEGVDVAEEDDDDEGEWAAGPPQNSPRPTPPSGNPAPDTDPPRSRFSKVVAFAVILLIMMVAKNVMRAGRRRRR